MASFADQVAAWAEKAKGRATAVYKASAQDLVEQMLTPVAEGGNLPVKTGFLRSSLLASTEAMPKIDPNATPPEGSAIAAFAPDFTQYNLAIASASLTDIIYLGFTAAYAPYQEAKRQFVGLAAQNWPSTVNRNAQKLRDSIARPSV